jgi:hypothetical protein
MNKSVMIAGLAWLTKANFAAHRRLDPTGLQQTFEQWLRSAERIEQETQARGIKVRRVEIDPDALAAWCRDRGVAVNSKARGLFAGIMVGETQSETDPERRH